MGNLQPSTFNLQRRSLTAARRLGHWASKGFLSLLLLVPGWLRAQAPPQIPPGAQAQLQVAQPAVDVSSPVTATAAFDPPVVRVGEKTFYRLNVDATESSILWPDEIPFPAQLQAGAQARGQLTQFLGDKFRPLTAFVYELTARRRGISRSRISAWMLPARRWPFQQ